MSKSGLFAVFGGENLTLHGDLSTSLLIVHLSTPPAVIERNGHRFTYDEIELNGVGSFEIRDRDALVQRLERQSVPHLRIVK